MSAISDRVAATIDRLGEVVSFTKLAGASGSFTQQGIVQPLDSGTAQTYINDVDIMGIVRPGLKLTVKSTTTIVANDEFTRGGISCLVLRVFPHKVGNSIICYTVIGG